MAGGELVCPQTGDPCGLNVCAIRQSEIDKGLENNTRVATLSEASPALAAADTVSHCVQERIGALAAVGGDEKAPAEVRAWADRFAKDLVAISQHPTESVSQQ